MNRTGDAPPPAVRQRIAYLRRLEAPVSLADDVLRIVDATPQIIDDYRLRGAPVKLIRAGAALPGRGRNLAAADRSLVGAVDR